MELGKDVKTLVQGLSKSLSLNDIRLFSVQILTALAFLKNKNLIHMDVKLENIILTKSSKENSISGNTKLSL